LVFFYGWLELVEGKEGRGWGRRRMGIDMLRGGAVDLVELHGWKGLENVFYN
jgi:hypothetical protein